jgi:hypothetical protein
VQAAGTAPNRRSDTAVAEPGAPADWTAPPYRAPDPLAAAASERDALRLANARLRRENVELRDRLDAWRAWRDGAAVAPDKAPRRASLRGVLDLASTVAVAFLTWSAVRHEAGLSWPLAALAAYVVAFLTWSVVRHKAGLSWLRAALATYAVATYLLGVVR